MKRFWTRDISPRAAAVVVALALIASVVTGREEPGPEARRVEAQGPASPANHAPQLPDLDVEKLNRADKKESIANLFASKAWTQPPAAAPAANPVAPPPPPQPTAPSLPFRYFGKWVDGDRTVVFLWKNSEGYSVAVGDTLDGAYRVESISDSAVNFIYLPLGSTQALPIAQPN